MVLDTRRKIVLPEQVQAEAPRPVVLVVGYFDPYHAEHARLLGELRARVRGTVAIAVAERDGSLLPVRARQEMLAALRCVDFVVAADGTDTLKPDEMLDWREQDHAIGRALRARVLQRSGLAHG